MQRNAALALIGVLAVVVGLLLGFSNVGDDCGSAFTPDYSQAQINDTFPGLAGSEDDCRDAVSGRRPIAYGALGVGALGLLLSFVVPSDDRRTSPES